MSLHFMLILYLITELASYRIGKSEPKENFMYQQLLLNHIKK